MSFILDALKRAEEQRTSGDLPNMATPAFSSAEKRTIPWLWIVIILLLLIIAIGLWFRPGNPTVPATPVSVATSRVTAPLVVTAPAPRAAVQKPIPRAAPKPVPKAATNKTVQIHGQVRHDITSQQSAPLIMHKPVVAPPPAEIKPVQVPSTSEIVKPVDEPAATPKYERLAEQDVPFRQSFPKFTINVHVSADEPAARFILVNLKRFNEGDRTPSGVTIEEITPNGVAASFRGRTVLVPATGNP